MPKLIYWAARMEADSECYSIIAKTKKEAQRKLAEVWNPEDFGPIEKRIIVYKDAFDFLDIVTSEGGGRCCGALLPSR